MSITVVKPVKPANGNLFAGTCPNCKSELAAMRHDLKIVMASQPSNVQVPVGYEVVGTTELHEAGIGPCPVCNLHAVDFLPVKT